MGSTTGLNFSVELPQGNSTKSQPKEKRTRRKVIKACAFCRRRKLRCDHKKPMCSTCVARRLNECLYTNKPDYGSDTTEVFGSPTNGNLSTKLDGLEQELKKRERTQTSNGTGAIAENLPYKKLAATKTTSYTIYNGGPLAGIEAVTSKKNVLRDYHTLQCKDSGRRIFYGPTSPKTFLARGNLGLLDRFRQLWLKVKISRKKWKQLNGFTMLREINLLEEAPQISNSLSGTLLQEVCRALPSYEKAKSAMERFFEDKKLFEINTIFDEKKVMKDFYAAFVPGYPSEDTGERPIVNLVPSGKKNYYKIGTIVHLLILANHHDKIPAPIERFFIFLSGLSTGKVMYIERAQFLMLRYYHRLKYAFTGGDNSHVMLLVDSMISTATYLGLNHDIRLLYDGQEDVVGDLQTLENLWCWIMFADFDVAFQMGRPLKITAAELTDNMLIDGSKTFYGLLKRFLKISRPMISEIYDNNRSPNLTKHCERLIDFIEREFPPMGYYTDINLIGEVSLRNVRILCQALSVLVAFYCLRHLAFGEMNRKLKNGWVKCTLFAFSLNTNLTIHCFELDKKNFPEMLKPECIQVTPYISYSISLMSGLVLRGLMAFYALAYYKMTLFESGLLITADKHEFDCDLKSLRGQDDGHIAFISYFRIFCQTFDRISNPDDSLFKIAIRRSHSFIVTTAIERVCRSVVEKVLEFRSNAESVWISSSHHLSDLNAVGKSETPQLPQEPLEIKEALLPEEIYVAGSNNTNINVDQVPTEQELDMTQMIADEFWETYNVGWQELLDNADNENIFSDLM